MRSKSETGPVKLRRDIECDGGRRGSGRKPALGGMGGREALLGPYTRHSRLCEDDRDKSAVRA